MASVAQFARRNHHDLNKINKYDVNRNYNGEYDNGLKEAYDRISKMLDEGKITQRQAWMLIQRYLPKN